MELQNLSDDADVLRIGVMGEVKLDSPDAEPLADLFGPDVYKRRVLMDLGHAPFVNSTGIGWMLRCHKRFRQAGGACVLHTVPPSVMQAIKIMMVDRVLNLAKDSDEAMKLVMKAIP